jgi:hypothetical protein
MTRPRVDSTRALLFLLSFAPLASAAQSRFDLTATAGVGSFHSYSSDLGTVLHLGVGVRLSNSLTFVPQVSYWSSHERFVSVVPELRWTSPRQPGASLFAGIGIGSESQTLLSTGEDPDFDYRQHTGSIVGTVGGEVMLTRRGAILPMVQARVTMGIASLEGAEAINAFGDDGGGMLFAVGLGLRFGRP